MFSFYSTLCTELYDYTKPVGYSLNGDIEYYKERLKDCRGRILEAASRFRACHHSASRGWF